ncbi:hypothetical protein HU200_058875 [Digitaria exilis]|uniref:VQ domain-containing protein n=1 Tax=Digitaria exilis TaxID=1010633 RepID=A0A835AHD2_9POAL|nr:hypothetical protein HU200_058875 [Digitaria exilis]
MPPSPPIAPNVIDGRHFRLGRPAICVSVLAVPPAALGETILPKPAELYSTPNRRPEPRGRLTILLARGSGVFARAGRRLARATRRPRLFDFITTREIFPCFLSQWHKLCRWCSSFPSSISKLENWFISPSTTPPYIYIYNNNLSSYLPKNPPSSSSSLQHLHRLRFASALLLPSSSFELLQPVSLYTHLATSMGEHHALSTSTTTMPAVRRAPHASTPPPPMARPKIKIIHIIAPEIIKTDVANFRSLVQRLTGKPTAAAAAAATTSPTIQEEEETKEAIKKRPRPAPATTTERGLDDDDEFAAKKRKIKCEVKVEEGGFGDLYDLDRGDLWMDLNPGGFLSFLEEEADLFRGLAAADDFLLPLGNSRLDLVGEMYAS